MGEIMTLKILNLYAGIGGNRKLWSGDIEVTAVENVPEIAKIYQDFFPQDKVIIADAHQYLLEHFKEFDFIWSSPPCPTHSRARFWGTKANTEKSVYPDMDLYQEIIFLQNSCDCLWVVENTISYYSPLIQPLISGSHYFWSNFHITNLKKEPRVMDGLDNLQKAKGFIVEGKDIDKRKVLRNCVEPELGLHIFNCAFKTKQMQLSSIPPTVGILEATL
jgi:DNA (cytosine-5)-methyltransferase 1